MTWWWRATSAADAAHTRHSDVGPEISEWHRPHQNRTTVPAVSGPWWMVMSPPSGSSGWHAGQISQAQESGPPHVAQR